MREKTKTFRDLIVWQKSMQLVLNVYKITETFPKQEIYGLVSQIRRAIISIPSNIAEGYIRNYSKEYAQFINIAFASGAELETHLEISKELGYITINDYNNLMVKLNEIMKMLNKLYKVLKTNS